jgi:hypothetical protein
MFGDYKDFNKIEAKSVVTRLAKDFEKAKRLADFIVAHEKNSWLNEAESAALIASIACSLAKLLSARNLAEGCRLESCQEGH